VLASWQQPGRCFLPRATAAQQFVAWRELRTYTPLWLSAISKQRATVRGGSDFRPSVATNLWANAKEQAGFRSHSSFSRGGDIALRHVLGVRGIDNEKSQCRSSASTPFDERVESTFSSDVLPAIVPLKPAALHSTHSKWPDLKVPCKGLPQVHAACRCRSRMPAVIQA